MIMVQEIVQKYAGPQGFVQDVLEVLQKADPQFREEAAAYQRAAMAIQEAGDGALEFLSAKEAVFTAGILYMGWQGFSLNLDIFQNPERALWFEEDLAPLYQEEQFEEMAAVCEARDRLRRLSQELRAQTEALEHPIEVISGYYAYLETVGYKLAHYLGLRMVEALMCRLVPENTFARIHAERYQRELEAYLQLDLGQFG